MARKSKSPAATPGPDQWATAAAQLEPGSTPDDFPTHTIKVESPGYTFSGGDTAEIVGSLSWPQVERRLRERPQEISAIARGFSAACTKELEKIKARWPNEGEPLAHAKAQVAIYRDLVSGFAAMADAIDEALNNPDSSGEPDLGGAATIAEKLTSSFQKFLSKHEDQLWTKAVNVSLLCGVAGFLHFLGADGYVTASAFTGVVAMMKFTDGKPKTPQRSGQRGKQRGKK